MVGLTVGFDAWKKKKSPVAQNNRVLVTVRPGISILLYRPNYG